MFGTSRTGELNGFLDKGSTIRGELHFEDTFRVEGTIHGSVTSHGNLVVGEQGVIDGTIDVGRVLISGEVRGKVIARKVELAKGCRVRAELETPALIIEEGAYFEGRCSMSQAGASDGAEEPRGPRPIENDDPQGLRRARKS
jgi:cytoskeletal protein CcmA (bactofilin family)